MVGEYLTAENKTTLDTCWFCSWFSYIVNIAEVLKTTNFYEKSHEGSINFSVNI